MSDHCGTTTEEGNAVCVPGACSCSSETQNNASIPLSTPSLDKTKDASKQPTVVLSNASEEKNHVEKNS
jgi:hypothetical protein